MQLASLKILTKNKEYIETKSTFYFVHHMHPHWPYKHDEQCNYKNFPEVQISKVIKFYCVIKI